MRKILFFVAACIFCASCDQEKANKDQLTIDSLKTVNKQLKQGYDDLLADINEVNIGFQRIAQAEERINTTSLQLNGETKAAAPTQDIRENMEFIIQTLEDNKAKIAALESKLNDSEYSSKQLLTMVNTLKQQMEDKQHEVQSLKNELQQKNVQIGKMGDKIDQLAEENKNVKDENEKVKQENVDVKNENQAVKVENEKVKQENETVKNENQTVKEENKNIKDENEKVKKENQEKEQVLQNQDVQINTAYYVFGTKKELKEHNILAEGEILSKANFDKGYFTKIDIRNTTTIKLYSKSANLLSKHPAGSYTMLKDPAGELTLKINSPAEFWSLTKYLVIRVK
jgi:chromosome segregation ATPase